MKITHYIEEVTYYERVKYELFDLESENLLGKSSYDLIPLVQNIDINIAEKKEEILNSIKPYRYYEKMGYRNFNEKEKLEFWRGRAGFIDRMGSPYTQPHKNNGLNVLDAWFIDEIYAEFEDDLLEFVVQLASVFGIKREVAVKLFESRNNKDKWIEVANKYKLY